MMDTLLRPLLRCAYLRSCSLGFSTCCKALSKNIPAQSKIYGYVHYDAPKDYSKVEMPQQRKLRFMEKVPQTLPGNRAFKMFKSLHLVRGPELIHNQLIHKQYGIIALQGGRMKHGHFEMVRMTVNRKMDDSIMFATWRIDAPWQPISKKGQGKRMGGGKGPIDHYATPVKAGRVIIEMGGKCEYDEVLPILKIVANNLPFKAIPVSQEIIESYQADEEFVKKSNLNKWTPEYVILNNFGGCHNWISPYDKKWFWRFI